MKSILVILLTILGFYGGYTQALETPPEDILTLRDPFKMPEMGVEEKRQISELDVVPVHQFKMLGVLTGAEKIRAILQAPSGMSFFVKENDRIGTRKGVITKILLDRVQVEEKILNVLGQEESVLVEVLLPEDRSKAVLESKASQGW